jgi:hypothetical protein
MDYLTILIQSKMLTSKKFTWKGTLRHFFIGWRPLHAILLMRANPLRGKVGGGWTLEIETFLGPVKWHLAVRRVPFGAQNS